VLADRRLLALRSVVLAITRELTQLARLVLRDKARRRVLCHLGAPVAAVAAGGGVTRV